MNKKAGGYATNPTKYIDPFLPWFKVITYHKGPYLVVDRYSGQEQYAGQEIYFLKQRPALALNFYGRVTNRRFRAVRVYNFLKRALRANTKAGSYRGLNGYTENGFLYKNKFKKLTGIVTGEERITYHGRLIYRQVYHGGAIEDKRSYKNWGRKLLPASNLKKLFHYSH